MKIHPGVLHEKEGTRATSSMVNVEFNDVLGRKMLIMGDVGTGKTALTDRLLAMAIDAGHAKDVSVLDMAPDSTTVRGITVGGKLSHGRIENIRIYQPNGIKTPRLSAKGAEELIELADHNRNLIEGLLDDLDRSPTRILFVNDVSMYLQRGDLERLWRTLEKAETVIANGYYGEKLREDFGTGLSLRERSAMEKLASRMENVIRS